MEKPVAQAPEKAASEEKQLDDKELELERERKLKKEQKAREKEEKKLKAKQKEAARLQAQATSDGPKKSEKKQKKKAAEDENPDDFIDPETPSGEKKSLAPQMAKQYSPSTVEKSWYSWWESAGYFGADPASSKPPFVIVLPPPNVTGALHIGHALAVAIEDAMIRWRRMSGYNALWVPGVDHAGIATQVVVEKKLMRERKLTRHDIGRDKFISEVLKWKDQYGGTILGQLRRLGASLDWSRECFTMDDQRSKAVTEAFVRLHKDGLIYRDYRLVNWDCTLVTAISDIEVDHLELKEETMLKVPGYSSPVQFGVLISFAYPLEEGLGEIIVATTRIETMLGDTAIAVHPEDKRYKHLHGKHAIHPFNGRKLKIICDAVLVDPTFGTGAVKITPAHDPNDFEVGKRHNLEFINIFTDDGKINSNGGAQFEGMPRFAARVAVIDALKEKGLYKDTKKNEMNLGICSRSNDVVEPMIKPQWFVNCHTMAKAGLDAVRSKKIEIIPQQYEQDWYRWLENIRDWCVSRQLWWGHRVPAWYVTLEDEQLNDLGSNNDRWIVARNECDAMLEAQKKYPGKKFQLNQDPDVLDTWFSSGLFPLTVLGWPDDTADLRALYPTSVLETGLDILFFWVARMVMMGMQLGGDVPFQKVYLHPMIRDAHGRKMSKSLGNVVDPLEVINGTTLEDLLKRLEEGNLDQNELSVAREGKKKDFPDGIAECGTDALRFALISYTSQSDKINLDIKRVVGYRQWCNKLWNAIRFAMGKLGDHYTPPATIVVSSMPPVCKWILSVLNKAIGKTVTSLEAYKFADATSAIYSWWQYQLCDVFIEAVKPYFFNDSQEFDSARAACRDALWVCLDNGLRLLHPFMPYVTEELWQRLPQPKDSCRKNSIMISEYPSVVTKGFFRGWVPTLIGYSGQGACKFGFYEFFKKYYSDIAGPEYAAKYKTLIYLAGSASAEVIADLTLCPMEAVKVRVQTQPGFAKGLSDGLPKFVKAEGYAGLYKGIVPLWGRQIPYTMMKFASFETIVERIYKYTIPVPKSECSKSLQLGVSFAGGYVAGVFCAIVSHPADNLVSFLNNAQGATVGDAVKKLGLWGLFTRGLPLRIVMIGTLTGAQWGIYDAFKVMVGLPTTGGVAPTPAAAGEQLKG